MVGSLRFKVASRFFALSFGIFILFSACFAQVNPTPPRSPERILFTDLLKDQRAFWTSPKHAQKHDLKWLAPFAGATAALIATDNHISKRLTYSQSQLSTSHAVSDIGVGCMFGAVGALYLDGHITHRDGRIKTGLLGAEAIAGSEVVVRVLKITTNRQRPTATGSNGSFRAGGDSFPSGHSIAAWSAATVLANRYSGKRWVKFSVYGLASAISLARVTGKNHYPSDVVVGGVLGYLIGSHVSRRYSQN